MLCVAEAVRTAHQSTSQSFGNNGEEEPTKIAPVTMIAIPLVMIIFLILAVTFN